nr:hypothetical protein [Tanacetum cinerariifolium]
LDSPAPKPTKTTRKPKPTAPKAHPRPSVSKPVLSSQPEPTFAPAKPHEKKRKLTTEISNKPSKAIQSRHGFVSKKHKPIITLRSVDESVAEDVPAKEPHVNDKEADVQRALEESMKRMYDVPQGPLPLVVIREPESGKYQPLLEVSRKEKEKAGSNPDEQPEGQARPDPDLDVADVLTQLPPEQMDEGFIATAYPKVQENLKLTVEEQVLLEEPASSSGTLSSLQHLTKDLSFGDIFFSDKPSKADNDKATAKTEAKLMVSVTIQQDMSSIPPMTSQIIDLTLRPESPKVHQLLKATATEITTTTTTTKLLPPPYQQQQSTAEAMMMKHIGELEHIMANLIQENKRLEQRLDSHGTMQAPLRNRFRDLLEADMKEILHQHLQMDEDMAPDEQAQSSNDEDIGSAHILKASALASNYSPPPEDSLLAQTGDIAMFIDCVDDSILRHNVSKPLPLGGPPGQVTIQSDFFFNKDLEYLRYDSKGSRPALSISKMKAAYYPYVGLEQMVPDQIWIEEECKCDIAAMYGISHWWFQRQRFYIDRYTSEENHRAVRTYMRILSVVKIEVFSMYGYDNMKKIVLRRADLNDHVILERDFKYLYPKDFQLGIESYQTQLNLTKPRWDATGFEYKHDYTVIDSSRSVTFRDRYDVQMIMRFNEIHKFSDGTLHQIDEALDYQVKEFKINRMNPGLNTRFWTKKDVDRSKAFMFAIQKRLKTRRIFRNLESFVGGRVKDGDYRLLKRIE